MTDEKSSEAKAKIEQKKKMAAKKAQAAKAAGATSGLEAVLLRNNFYRNNYRRMVTINLLFCLIIAGLVGFMFWQYYTRPVPKFFATTEDGKLFPVYNLSRPNYSRTEQKKGQQKILNWAIEAAQASYTYDFVNWRKELQDAKLYYTGRGHRSLLKAIDDSRNLEAVKTKKMTTSTRITGNPRFLERPRNINGRYTWKVEFPMEVLYTNGKPKDEIIQRIIVTLTIIRVPIWDSSSGIGINSIVVRENIPPRPRAKG